MLDDGTRLSGLIVEVEAYLGVEDRAAHSYGGRRTPRNEAMYAAPGTAYIYFTYGMHHCANVVCGREGEPVAVLLRALEPLEGVGAMRRFREATRRRGGLRDRDLASGPGRLCRALALDLSLNGVDLTTDPRLWIELDRSRPFPAGGLVNTPRIGVEGAGEPAASRLLRWHVRGNAHVSRRRRGE